VEEQASVLCHGNQAFGNHHRGAENKAVNPVHVGRQLPQSQEKDQQHDAAYGHLAVAPYFTGHIFLLGHGHIAG
jgi:hypothetical protein